MLKSHIGRIGQYFWLRRLGQTAFRFPIIGRAFRKVVERILPRGERIWVQISSGPAKGIWLKVNPYWESTLMRGDPEWHIQEVMLKYLKPDDCFYDVGAHIGYYSLFASRYVGVKGSVISFEPDSDNIAVFRENLAKNNLMQILIVPAAVWSDEGVVVFQKGADYSSRMSGRVVSNNSAAAFGAEMLSCSAVSLDSFCLSHRPPTFIKIDVEGEEIDVLKGARQTLAQHKPVLLIEVHNQENIAAMGGLLTPLNYSIEVISVKNAN
jgi:FkbM family methyltransferase